MREWLTASDPVAILAVFVFLGLAVMLAKDAANRGMDQPTGYGMGLFVVLLAGAAVYEWIGAALAGLALLGLYLHRRP